MDAEARMEGTIQFFVSFYFLKFHKPPMKMEGFQL